MSILHDAYVVLNTAEVFDPATGQFTAVASMHKERVEFALVMLPDWRAMAVGGDYYVISDKHFYPGDAETY